MVSSGSFYTRWYPKQWLGGSAGNLDNLHADLRDHVQYGASTSRKLARGVKDTMMRFGPKLDREQLLLSRFVGPTHGGEQLLNGLFVGIATELFAMCATCAFAQAQIDGQIFAAERFTL